MYNNKINGFIIEGADQQGKTTLVDTFFKDHKATRFKAPEKDFDFYYGYTDPFIKDGCVIYDRSFISELVYSRVLGREIRVTQLSDLIDFFNINNFIFIFLQRSNYKWNDREEMFGKELNEKFILEYRKVFSEIQCEKYFIDPCNVNDMDIINNLVNSRFK